MNSNATAADPVMQDLIDCLLAEQFFGPEPLALSEPREWALQYPSIPPFADLGEEQRVWQWCYDEAEQRYIVVALQPGITQAWEQVPGTPVIARRQEAWTVLAPESFMRRVFQGLSERYQDNEKGLELFNEVLRISLHQTELSQTHRIDSRDLLTKDNAAFFLAMEQWASLRDRPYHPLAKAKQGLSDADYRRYQAEFARPVSLRWVAVAGDLLQCGEGVADLQRQHPARYLLPEELQAELDREMCSLGIADSHVALPVHPWQFDHVLEAQLGDHFEAGDCRRLAFVSGNFFASSSLRSMTPCFDSADHLKLPLAVYSLGASRYLPAVKMINGNLSEALLRQALTLDASLQQSLHLCDERNWWAFMPPDATLFDEAPRHLSAMVRRYPQQLLADADCRLLPMAALGTPLPGSRDHFFDEWMQYRGLPAEADSVETLFRELCASFFEINLRMFRLGMLGEVHGQNAVLVWQAGRAAGLLLRDHDSLRIFVPWLERQGLADPCYRLKPGHTANTLYHERPEDLLFWLQTLGIQVNMRAIIDTLALIYALPQNRLWAALREELARLIDRIEFDDQARSLLQRELFERPTWPSKLLLTPMIARAGGPGSMPFGKGEVANPLCK